MLNNNILIKSSFTIKDLENISGVKAHTIRIWEKRYGLLSPQRTSGNIRYYNVENLQKLLNISLLNTHGYKISNIAGFSEQELLIKARELAMDIAEYSSAVNSLKLAMFNFDVTIFQQVYHDLLLKNTFREIFKDVFLPFLNHLGLLWQTNTITPAHEHFISCLIEQKLHVQTEKIQINSLQSNRVYVLFLPENEIHELGLLYVNYELLLRGCRTIFLGQNVPISNLKNIVETFEQCCLISYFIVSPNESQLMQYFEEIQQNFEELDYSFYCVSHKINKIDTTSLSNKFHFFSSTLDLISNL